MPASHPSQHDISAIAELLACPACGGGLRLEADKLICTVCNHAYPIVDGIPVLTPQNP
jgi:uncharacterized protein YbaR (Trm112 family)